MALHFVASLIEFFSGLQTGKMIPVILSFEYFIYAIHRFQYKPSIWKDKHVSNFNAYVQPSKTSVDTFSNFSGLTPPGLDVEPTEGMYRNNQSFVIQVKITRNSL